MSRARRYLVWGTLFAALLLLLSALLIEGSYRIYLRLRVPERFLDAADGDDLPPALGFYNRSLWEYDEELGYRYARGPIRLATVIQATRISDRCVLIPQTNARGNQGRIRGSWEEADFKVAVFGDSFTAAPTLEGMTWPNYLQDELEERIGRSVNVANFGRDGTGLLQMFDMVRSKVPEWKPDLAIIAFITDDLGRARSWRTVTSIDGEMRVLTIPAPSDNPDPSRAYETFIVHPEATAEWCAEASQRDELDRIGREVLDRYMRFRRPEAAMKANVFYRGTSFVLDRVRFGDPFHHTHRELQEGFSLRLDDMDDYASDERMVANIRFLEELGTRYVLVHLPYLPELEQDREYILTRPDEKRLKGLESLTGRRVHGLLDYVERPVADPVRLTVRLGNTHPNAAGMQFYAQAVSELIVRNSLAPSGNGPRDETVTE